MQHAHFQRDPPQSSVKKSALLSSARLIPFAAASSFDSLQKPLDFLLFPTVLARRAVTYSKRRRPNPTVPGSRLPVGLMKIDRWNCP
ncbi:unnamed protein product [Victoria cruziana]